MQPPLLALCILTAAVAPTPAGLTVEVHSSGRALAPGPLFLVDDTRIPHAAIQWPTISGPPTRLEVDAPYASIDERVSIGHNIQCFVMVGGTRLDKGAGHPAGVVVRVAFYKEDIADPFFESLPPGALIRVELKNVAFNQPASPRPRSIVQHLKYSLTDVLACGLTEKHQDQYNTADPADTLNGAITAENGRLGILAAGGEHGGTMSLALEADGTTTLVAEIPYSLFRHVRDPWLRTNPGTFFEPTHFHVEFEALPADVAAEIDAAPAKPAK